MNEGTIQPLEGRSLVRFERRYPHSMERVWAALTEPEQLHQWFGEGDIELELVEGGRFDVVTTGPAELVGAMIEFGGGEEALERHDTVLQVDPPRLLEHTFYGGESVVRWELQPDGDGCLLRLTHTMGAPAGPGLPAGAGGLAHRARPARAGARRRPRAVDAGRLEPQPRDLRREGGTMSMDSRRRWLALIVLCLGDLMIVLDTTIVNVALPSIREDLGFSETSLAWVVNAYLLTFGGFLLLGGRLGDLYGHRRLFLVGIALFTVGVAGLRPRDLAGHAGRGARGAGPRRRGGVGGRAVADHDAVHRAGRARQGDGRLRLRRGRRRQRSACCSAAC